MWGWVLKSDAAVVEEYLSGLNEERREAVTTVREVVLANLPEGDEGGLKRVGLGI